ncbi:C99L2 protein, partial [Odontophorus gujanensis]|nr:C99L2 protein [Odontophorus gujanensis]
SNSHNTSLLAGHGDDAGEFSLEDALGPILQLDLADFFDSPVEPTRPARPTARPFPRPAKPDNGFWDIIRTTTTTKRPKTTQAPRRHNPGKNPSDLDLADALGDGDDVRGGGQAGLRPGEGLSDSDLESIVNDGYSPDKKKGREDLAFLCPADNRVETGTIAGIASALAMALVGAVSSYISYQQKKFCFSIEQGLNAEYVKGENMEAVVSEEPQVKYSVLETQSAEPPKHDGAKV